MRISRSLRAPSCPAPMSSLSPYVRRLARADLHDEQLVDVERDVGALRQRDDVALELLVGRDEPRGHLPDAAGHADGVLHERLRALGLADADRVTGPDEDARRVGALRVQPDVAVDHELPGR